MTFTLAVAILIHILVLSTGVFLFFRLIGKMNRERIVSPPVIDLFFLFVNYGGLLGLVLTILFWNWSGMASIGALYLILGAPIIMCIIAFRQYHKRELSIYHKNTFLLGIYYFIIAPLTFLALFIVIVFPDSFM